MTQGYVKVRAHSNIALIKYWGKRDTQLKLPQNSSLSLTLDRLYTETEAYVLPMGEADQFWLNQIPATAAEAQRMMGFLEFLRQELGCQMALKIVSENNFPTAAGLASSASGFAALTLAATQAMGYSLSPKELSLLARRGSGSACRSLFGGFVIWHRGEAPDGHDSFAEPLHLGQGWDLTMLVLVLNAREKAVSSSLGMEQTVKTSPLYPGWLASVSEDLAQIQIALAEQDFTRLGQTMEHNALKMHATSLAAKPAVIYWQAESLALLLEVQKLRSEGLEAYCTMDAGPNLKVLVETAQAQTLITQLQKHPAIQKIIPCKPGPDASVCISSAEKTGI